MSTTAYKNKKLAGLFGVVLGTAFLVSAYTPAAEAASRMCAKRTIISKMLGDKYKESPRAIGLTEKGKAAFEFYVSEKGTWTVMMTNTKGVSCIMAAGHSWEDRDKLAYLPKS